MSNGITTPIHAINGSFQQITVSNSAVGLTVPKEARMAAITVENQPLRYRDDGTDPTASVGVLLKADASMSVFSHSLGTIKFIRQGGSDSKINVSYYGG